MSETKAAGALVRGDRINVRAAIDAALVEADERFFFDHVDADEALLDAVVEGVSVHQECATVYVDATAFSVPADFPIRIVAYADEYSS